MKKFIFGMVHTKPSGHYTPHAVESFLRCTKLDNTQLHIIDNDQDIKKTFPEILNNKRINLVERPAPFSFAQNANELAMLALENKADLFFLNNDIVFSENWVGPFLLNHRSIQVPSSNNQYQYQNGELRLEFSMTLENYVGKEIFFNQSAKAHCARNLGLVQRHSIPYYAVHIPFQVLKLVGLFDERFAPYGWEDTDYSVRCYKEGIPLFVNSDSYILHFYGKSTWNRDNHQKTQGDKHCAKLFVEKWGGELADLFGFQTDHALKYLSSINGEDLTRTLRDLIHKKAI